MVGIQPIKRHLDALSGPDRARTIIVPLLRHTMLCHGVTLRSTLCSRPTAIPNLRSRLVETEERQRSHVGHSHSCDLRREGVSYAQIDQIFPNRRPSSIDRYRDDEPFRSRDKCPPMRRKSSIETLNSQTMRRSNCVSAEYTSHSDS